MSELYLLELDGRESGGFRTGLCKYGGEIVGVEAAVERMAAKLYAASDAYPHIDTQGLDEQDCGILAGEMLFALLATEAGSES